MNEPYHTLSHLALPHYTVLHRRIQGAMGAFLCMLTDGDLEVRKSCLLMVNAVTHHHPEVVAPFLRDQVSECVGEGVCVCVSEGGREGLSVYVSV